MPCIKKFYCLTFERIFHIPIWLCYSAIPMFLSLSVSLFISSFPSTHSFPHEYIKISLHQYKTHSLTQTQLFSVMERPFFVSLLPVYFLVFLWFYLFLSILLVNFWSKSKCTTHIDYVFGRVYGRWMCDEKSVFGSFSHFVFA